jgi:hypothetical protein
MDMPSIGAMMMRLRPIPRRSMPLVAVLILAAGCAAPGSPTPTSGITASAHATASPALSTATPAPSASVPEVGGLEYGFALAAVGVDELHPEPYGIDGYPLEVPAWSSGDRLLVLAQDPGRTGSLVLPVDLADYQHGLAWVPSDALRDESPACPAGDPTFFDLIRLGRAAILCTGNADFLFTAYVPATCGIADGIAIGTPDWLNGTDNRTGLYGEDPPGIDDSVAPASGALFAHPEPPGFITNCQSTVGRWFDLTAHVDDPDSASCAMRVFLPPNGEVVWPAVLAQAMCRLQLVVTEASPTASP